MSIPQMLHFDDVDVYEARNNYWVGRALDGISGGGSLYLKDRVADPWGFSIECAPDGSPRAVHFRNGTIWSFCCIKARYLEHEWPRFVEDYRTGEVKMRVRVERIYSDGFYIDLVSENAILHDVLVWHYFPK